MKKNKKTFLFKKNKSQKFGNNTLNKAKYYEINNVID